MTLGPMQDAPLKEKEIDGHLLKHAIGHCGEKPCITVLALWEVIEARELLRGLMDYHNVREACVHLEGPQVCQETITYLEGVGE